MRIKGLNVAFSHGILIIFVKFFVHKKMASHKSQLALYTGKSS